MSVVCMVEVAGDIVFPDEIDTLVIVTETEWDASEVWLLPRLVECRLGPSSGLLRHELETKLTLHSLLVLRLLSNPTAAACCLVG